jgi:glucokinase
MVEYIVCDIGGTRMRAGRFSSEGTTPLDIKRIATRGKEPVEVRLAQLIESIWSKKSTIQAIGVAAPGPVNPKSGIIYKAPNIPAWENFPLAKYLGDIFNVPIILGNDANMAAVGEWKYGSGKDHHDLIYVTISTGVGGGIITNDQLLLGSKGLAGEIGHITVLPNGPLFGCGKRGHLEAIASGTGISNYVIAQLSAGFNSSLSDAPEITAEIVAKAAIDGDELAVKAYQRAGKYLGHAIAEYLHIFNPSIIILGGGVVQTGDLLLVPFHQALKRKVLTEEYLVDLEIKIAQLGDRAGLLGTLTTVRDCIPK